MKHSRIKRAILFLLLTSMLASAAACGDSGSAGTDTTASTTNTADTTVDTSLRENTPDSLPSNLNFNGQVVRIGYAGGDKAHLDVSGEETGDIVDDAVFSRQRSVEERLNIKFEYIAGDPDGVVFLDNVRTTITAGDDAYDMINGYTYRMTVLANNGYLCDLADAEYLDFDQPWWAEKYNEAIALNSNSRYMLCGDLSLSQTKSLSCIFFNRTLYESNFGSPDDLYQLVLDGKWTYETMAEYVKGAFRDLNSDGKAGYEDVIGLATTQSGPTEHFAYPAGMQITTRDKDGYPTFITDQTRNVEITEKLYKLMYETEGTFVSTDPYAINNEIPQYFSSGTILFYPGQLGDTSKIRDASEPYGILPRPKLNEAQASYLSLPHDATSVYAVPITCGEVDIVCAAMEAMAAQGYRTVVPAYYETALKIKYTHDDMSAQIIDIIHDNITTDFIYANNYALGTKSNLGTIQRQLMKAKSTDFMSTYDSMKTEVKAALDTLIAQDKENNE
ncbi:MAG: extracellular solute-binding protein [Clostridia bacterium]|nr:extracellular solute-binding protein [Clostridia bacterium]